MKPLKKAPGVAAQAQSECTDSIAITAEFVKARLTKMARLQSELNEYVLDKDIIGFDENGIQMRQREFMQAFALDSIRTVPNYYSDNKPKYSARIGRTEFFCVGTDDV